MTPDPGPQAPDTGQGQDPNAAAPWSSVEFGPPEPWVLEEPYDATVPAKEGAHVTYLLWSRQSGVRPASSFHCVATRLETALAVQNESQWRMNLDPRFQRLCVHWLRVVRGTVRIDHLKRERMRFMQRETQLEHHVINGCWTLLAVLDDVRPGDIIEAAYSFHSEFPISRGWSETFFSVPAAFVVGRYRLCALLDPARPMPAWRASADAPTRRQEPADGGLMRWTWEGSQAVPRDPERNVPSSHMDYTWIQLSDIPGWDALAARVHEAWSAAGPAPEPALFPAFARPAEVGAGAVRDLVRRIQDDFRYLSIDLATGGWVPADPSVVARRLYGDCKDLAWLCCTVLRAWGVRAAPVLVGTGLRGSIGALLPMTALFNHAVLEVECEGRARWFDLTLRRQGGGFDAVPVGSFGMGLAADGRAQALVTQPAVPATNLIAMRETLWLDTRKDRPCAAEQRLWAEGFQAENFRRTLLAQGLEGFAKERLTQAQKRYGKAQRVGTVQVRDDRERNVFELAESFELTGVVYPGEGAARANYDVPANTVALTFAVPEDKPRRCPWAMPHPYQVRHTATVVHKALKPRALRRRKWTIPGLPSSLEQVFLDGEYSKTACVAVEAAQVEPASLADFRAKIADFLRATSTRFYLPWDISRPDLRKDFGQLPPPERGVAAYVPAPDLRHFEEAELGEDQKPSSRFVNLPRGRALSKSMRYAVLAWILIVAFAAVADSCQRNGGH